MEIYAQRLLYLFLAIKTFSVLMALTSSHFLQSYNSQTELLLAGAIDSWDAWLRKLLAPFASWDSAYFLQIATNGYELENQHAFFPFYPWLMRLGAEALERVGIPLVTGCLLTGLFISNVCHFLTVVNVHRYSYLCVLT